MSNMHLSIGDRCIAINRHARLQRGFGRNQLTECLQANSDELNGHRQGLIILECVLHRYEGHDPVKMIDSGDIVRYDDDRGSKAQAHNQQLVPYVLVDEPVVTSECTVYIMWIGGFPNVVRAHFGKPYPPFPFNTSAEGWPGYRDEGGNNIDSGRSGCQSFWDEAALCFYNPELFEQMTSEKPDWLI